MFVHFPGRARDKKRVRGCQCRRYLLVPHHPSSWRKKSKERRNGERLRSCCAGFKPINRKWASPFFIWDTELPALSCFLQNGSKSPGYQNFLLLPSLTPRNWKVEEQSKKYLVIPGPRNPEPPSPVFLCLRCTQWEVSPRIVEKM